jgi:acetolactate synthase-1/2/3 large subunit
MAKETITGAEFIARFIEKYCFQQVFLVTGGACAFIVDAIGQNKNLNYVCFQHEQSAAMAADAIWRTNGKIGVTVSTSGPGATNLITGIACSYFDSIPTLHITGQVNKSESKEEIQADVRQAGFQETDIVSVVSPLVKWAHKVKDVDDLVASLMEALRISMSGRMGPVLIDVPMNVQKDSIDLDKAIECLGENIESSFPKDKQIEVNNLTVKNFLEDANRPLVIIGAGGGLSGTARTIQRWCEVTGVPFVTTWSAFTFVDRSSELYLGSLGVYGGRHANWAVQAADKIIVFGSRLDNRQRTSNPKGFAPFAKILVFDIDKEELNKYDHQRNYQKVLFDLTNIGILLDFTLERKDKYIIWQKTLKDLRKKLSEGFEESVKKSELNPYSVIRNVQKRFKKNSIVVSDTGANLCWVFQSYLDDSNYIFSAFGNSPMGYSLPAAIGAQIANPEKEIYCFIGDGGLQMNIQELQTIDNYNLPIKIIILNNFGYGIIKQFQDSYFESRYHATGNGYSSPNFEKIALAYNFKYNAIKNIEDLENLTFEKEKIIIDVLLPSGALITPKTEMNRFIHDQFPYESNSVIKELPFKYPKNPSDLN